MKRTLVRATAVAFAVIGLSVAPAAAAPVELEVPGTSAPVVSAPGGGSQITPDLSPCQVIQWWLWCRK